MILKDQIKYILQFSQNFVKKLVFSIIVGLDALRATCSMYSKAYIPIDLQSPLQIIIDKGQSELTPFWNLQQSSPSLVDSDLKRALQIGRNISLAIHTASGSQSIEAYYSIFPKLTRIFSNSNQAKIDDAHKDFIWNSYWKKVLDEKQYKLFHFPSVATYAQALKPYFDCQIFQQRRFPITNTKLFWRNTFQGYMQEVRCITRDLPNAQERHELAAKYLDEFINSLPFIEGEIEPKGDELMVNYMFTYFLARKKKVEKEQEGTETIEI